MRKRRYISPSSITCWLTDEEDFYVKYLADTRTPRPPQTKPMAIGSAFDAFIKCYLSSRILGKKMWDERELFEAQVEKQNWDAVWDDGRALFEWYVKLGGPADLITMANGAAKFEFSLQGEVGGVTLMGKPDMWFEYEGTSIILDWKVNGYYSKKTPSPAKGYVSSLGSFRYPAHRAAVPEMYNGVQINGACTLEEAKVDWARQISIYGWLMGEPVGGDFIAAIDQLLYPRGVAQHRCLIGADFQHELLGIAQDLWDRCSVEKNWFFRDMSVDESRERQRMLDGGEDMVGDELFSFDSL